MAVHLAIAGDVFDSVFMCCPFSPRDVLDELWDLIEIVSEGFPTYFWVGRSGKAYSGQGHGRCRAGQGWV